MAFGITSKSPEATGRIGAALGSVLQPGDVLCLVGPLGAGKTCLVQGIVKGAHPDASGPVRSPSFTLIAEYPGPVPIYHIDLFRLHGLPGDREVGVEELLGGPGCCLIEWADRSPQWMPAERLDVELTITGPRERHLHLTPRGQGWIAREEKLHRAVLEVA
ncbi:MAG: tRNA (adenosine(37)-N6)-threonylcarbamoyltransferase complex ATPase subunit type 1 TsaE [Candidatus Tectimicrobiota bacterium]